MKKILKALEYSNWIILGIGMILFWIITGTFISNSVHAYIIDFFYITCIAVIIFLAFKYKVSFIFNLALSTILIFIAVVWKEYYSYFGDIPSFAMIAHISKAFDNATGYGMSTWMKVWFALIAIIIGAMTTFYIMIFRKIERNNNRVFLNEILKASYVLISFIIPTVLTLHISTIGSDWPVEGASYFYSNDYLYKEVYSNKKFAGAFGASNLLVRNFMKGNNKNYTEKDIIDYLLSRDEQKKNTWTNKYNDYNLVNIVVETLDTRLIHPLISPNLYYLLNNSITFDNYYANSWFAGATCNSEWMMLTSMLPALTSESWTNSLCWDDDINTLKLHDSMPKILEKNGYTTHYVHTGFEDTYRRSNMMTNVLGFQNSYFGANWYQDRVMTDYIKGIDFNTKQFVQILTVSMHNGWHEVWDENYEMIKNTYPELKLDILFDYYAKMIETDMLIGEVINKLKVDGVYDKTLITVSTDHWLYSFNMEKTELMDTLGFAYQSEYDAMKNTLIVHDGGKTKQKISNTMSQIDIMPTLLNFLLPNYNANKMFGKNATYESSPVLFQDLSIIDGNKLIKKEEEANIEDRVLVGKMMNEYEWQKKILKSKYV